MEQENTRTTKTTSSYFKIATAAQLADLTNVRVGEEKLGQHMRVPESENWLQNSDCKFLLLGIPEDIGVRANGGVGGTQTLWPAFLRVFANIQHTDALRGENILLAGHFDFQEWLRESQEADLPTLRKLVAKIDDEVFLLIEKIVAAGKIPIVIGGGHNNSYPLLKGASLAKKQSINCINLDAHSDFRQMEGRHSGNGFRYAMHEKFLAKYAMVGLHRNYNSQAIVGEMAANANVHFSFLEDLLLSGKSAFSEMMQAGFSHCAGAPTGIELDIDCIEDALASAATPCGISTLEARQFLVSASQHSNVAYLHLAEGAVELADGRHDAGMGKLVGYLVADFIRAALFSEL